MNAIAQGLPDPFKAQQRMPEDVIVEDYEAEN